MPTERNGPGSSTGWQQGESAASDRSSDADTDQPLSSDSSARTPQSSSSGRKGDQSDSVGQSNSRLLNAVTLGAAGAAGGGVAGTLVGWGGVGVAAAGGAVGLPVVVPVAAGAAAGVGVVVAAKALRGPVARASSAVRDKFADAEPEATERGATGEAEGASVGNSGYKGTKSGTSRVSAAAGAAGAAGAAAVVAGASLIPKLRRRVFKNAKPGHIRVPPHARRSLYEEQQGICKGCGNKYLRKDLGIDHIVPRAKGGTNKIENLQLLCHHCNAVKGIRSWESFLKSKQHPGSDTGSIHPVDQPVDEES